MIEIALFTVAVVKKGGCFPDGPVVENAPANAGDIGLIPGPEIYHMPWAAKPVCPNYWSLCSTTTEATVTRSPCAANGE